MKIKVLKIRLSNQFQKMDEDSVNDFFSNFEVISMETKLIEDEINYWSILLCYKERSSKPTSNKTSISSEEELSPEEMIIYNKLKNWRAEKAKEFQLPAYIIFHNNHLMSIAKHKPCNLEDLENVNGIGKSKVEKFGMEIIKVLENA